MPLKRVGKALEKCKDLGLTKSIGVSNFNHKQLELILNKPGLKYKPACNQVAKDELIKATKIAIDAGFRHFDSAYLYGIEEEAGQAIRSKIADGTVKREDIFYTSKAMEKCKDAGLAKSIGVSNFNRRQLEMILNKPGLKYKPVCNQVECHVYLNQSKMLEYCKSKDIALIAYCTLGSSRDPIWVDQSSPFLLDDPVLCTMAKKYKQTPALVAFRYLLQRGIVTLAISFNEKRIKEMMQVMYALKHL
ncbi:3-alpha-hydroxysteroid dehydrogenase [Microtus ochrogaster]|uniref:3-alpha-hydroxysteroid dehydrogenase n=1 Tax=Microtus ochrogaster TaxID=79684 RepID=A0A8J6GGM2_MICOH|nr:3-alpha-hydroxysteroid dehydrogenase [Microtus ochrogaster]